MIQIIEYIQYIQPYMWDIIFGLIVCVFFWIFSYYGSWIAYELLFWWVFGFFLYIGIWFFLEHKESFSLPDTFYTFLDTYTNIILTFFFYIIFFLGFIFAGSRHIFFLDRKTEKILDIFLKNIFLSMLVTLYFFSVFFSFVFNTHGISAFSEHFQTYVQIQWLLKYSSISSWLQSGANIGIFLGIFYVINILLFLDIEDIFFSRIKKISFKKREKKWEMEEIKKDIPKGTI